MQKNNSSILERLNEPQILFTILYILAIAIGMIFNYAKYKTFGINIFDYADFTDFILFPFSDIKVLLFTIAIAIICYIIFYIDLKIRDFFPDFFTNKIISKNQYKTISVLISTVIFVLFIFVISEKYSQNFYKNIDLAQDITIYTKTVNYKGKYVGKTSDVIFIYQEKKLKIFPITSNITYYQIN